MFEGGNSTGPLSWKPLAAVDRECFACGPDNTHGLKMSFESNGEKLRSRLKMEPKFRGWSNLIHGGILSTMLDEIMGWTVICLTGRFMLTKSMNVSFRKPVRTGAELTVTGFIKERQGERRALVRAEIHDEKGDLCAASEGEFALFSREQFLRMKILPEEDLAAMESVVSP